MFDHALNNFHIVSQLEQNAHDISPSSPGIEAKPYMDIENETHILTDSEASLELYSPDREPPTEEKPIKDMWLTPMKRSTKGMPVLTCRRINFEIPEDEEEAKV